MVVDVVAATSDSDSTHFESIAKVVEAHAAASAIEADAAALSSFRTYRSRRVASYCPLRSGPARAKDDAFGSNAWRRRAPSRRRQAL